MSDISINEVMYNPSGPDSGYQWLELLNNTTEEIDLSNWEIQTGGSSFNTVYTLPPGTTFGPKQILLVGEEQIPSDLTVDNLQLQNGGSASDGVRLLDDSGNVISVVVYDKPNSNELPGIDGLPVPKNELAPTATNGKSLAWINGNWTAVLNPTPGEPNTNPKELIQVDIQQTPQTCYANLPIKLSIIKPPLTSSKGVSWQLLNSEQQIITTSNDLTPELFLAKGKYRVILSINNGDIVTEHTTDLTVKPAADLNKLKIVEVFPHPASGGDEYILLKNYSDIAIPLYGFALSDNSEDLSKYQITDDILIKPGSTTYFYKSDTKIALNNSGDTVILTSPQGQVIDQVTFQKTQENISICFHNSTPIACTASLAKSGITTLGLIAILIISVIISVLIWQILSHIFKLFNHEKTR